MNNYFLIPIDTVSFENNWFFFNKFKFSPNNVDYLSEPSISNIVDTFVNNVILLSTILLNSYALFSNIEEKI